MAREYEWDKYEAALLLDACIQASLSETPKLEIVSQLSHDLRTRALNNGLEIDEKFRNENGIFLQMIKMEYLLTKGNSGLPGGSKLFADTVKLKEDFPQEYYKILGIARRQIREKKEDFSSNKERFTNWLPLKSIKKFSPSTLVNALDEGSLYCVSHGISKVSFWSISDKDQFSKVGSKLLGMRLFRITHKNAMNILDRSIQLYKEFLKEQEET